MKGGCNPTHRADTITSVAGPSDPPSRLDPKSGATSPPPPALRPATFGNERMVIARVPRLPSLLLVACLGLPGIVRAALPTVPDLRDRLDDPVREVREAAINALGALADREAIPALLRAVREEGTRYEATLALCALPDVRTLQVYLRGLTDKSQEVRKASALAMEKIRGEAAP